MIMPVNVKVSHRAIATGGWDGRARTETAASTFNLPYRKNSEGEGETVSTLNNYSKPVTSLAFECVKGATEKLK